MNILWQNAWLAPALVLIAVPVLVHLFARARPKRYVFSSTEFLSRAVRKTMRVKRPQDWLLLILRTLLFLIVLLLFLKPILFSDLVSPSGASRNVVVVVDASASMASVEAGRTNFAAATAEASEILSGLSAGDQANVIFVNATPAAELPELSPNLAFLRERLRQAVVTQEAGNAAQALSAAAALLGDATGERELWIVSDFQRANWEGAAPPVPESVAVRYLRVGEGEASNIALTAVRAEPAAPMQGEDVTLIAEVANYSPSPRQVTVFVEAGEIRESQQVSLPAWGKGSALFQGPANQTGPLLVRFGIDSDAFSPDDERRLLVPVGSGVTATLMAQGSGQATGDTWKRALKALPQVAEVLDRGNFEKADGSLGKETLRLVAAMPPGDRAIPVYMELLQGGGMLWMQPASKREMKIATGVTANNLKDINIHREVRDEPWRVELVAQDHPAFQIFKNGDSGDPTRATFHARYRVDPEALPKNWKTLLAFDDGAPALVEAPIQWWQTKPGGHFLLWFMDLDPQYTNWPKQTEFLMLVGELVESGRQGLDTSAIGIEPGRRLIFDAPAGTVPSEVTLTGPDGAPAPVRRVDQTEATFFSEPARVPGVYTWRIGDEPVAHGLVNFPPTESDLRGLPEEALTQQPNAMALAEGTNLRDFSEGRPLWPALVVATIFLILCEALALLWTRRA